MKIKRIQLKNGYKRFHDLTIDLGDNPARIVALLGPNGCGKSSVFDGMLFRQQVHSPIGNEGQKAESYHSMLGEPSFSYQNIVIDFVDGDFAKVYSDKSQKGEENTIFSFRSPYRYNRELKINEVKSLDRIEKNYYGASSTSAIDQKMEENYRRLFAHFNNYRDEHDLKPSEAKKAIIGELNSSLQRCLEIKIDSLGNVEDNKGSLFFTKYDQQKPYEFDVLSSGEKEVVDIILDLYLRKDRYSDTIFIIDEPELHVNTSIQKLLLMEIEKLIGPNCQIWIATHSIGLMRGLQTELKDMCQIIHFQPGDNFASEAITLTPIKKNHSSWRKIFRTALDDLTTLVSPRQIIYCEGRDVPVGGVDKGFDARVYNQVFGEEFPEALFVSSGGNTELDQRSEIAIKILSKVFEDLEILVLKDRDFKSNRKASSSDRDQYLKTAPKNHRMLRRFEIENYLYDEEILRAFCAVKGVVFDKDTYDSFVSDIINSDIKAHVGKIKQCCFVDVNVSNEEFQLQLAKCITENTRVYGELRSAIFDHSAHF